MSDRILKLLIIDPDLIYCTGLRVVLERFSDLQVVSQAETPTAALEVLVELFSNTTSISTPDLDLVLLELCLEPLQPTQSLGLQLCEQLKTQYSNLPILLLSSTSEPTQLAAARQIGVDGYCHKSISVSQLVTAIRQVAARRSYWVEQPEVRSQESRVRSYNLSANPNLIVTAWNRLLLPGLQQIDVTLAEVTSQLQIPGLPLLDRAFLAGQRRELLASRWLVKQMLVLPPDRSQEAVEGRSKIQNPKSKIEPLRTPHPQRGAFPITVKSQNSSGVSLKTLQFALFESIRTQLQFSLENLTSVPLEIDIFREEKKRELLELILEKVEEVLQDLRFAQVQPEQLLAIQPVILRDLWQATIIDYFGKYSILRVGEQNVEFVNFLLRDVVNVQIAILNKIPLVVDLFSYLLFETPLMIDNISYPAGSLEAKERAAAILQNLLIDMGNAVVQPLLNQFADVEAIKQSFYDRSLISTREIERFRNSLSWKYRWGNYVGEPQAIFESRYELFVLVNRGIAQISVYAARRQELAQLSRVQLALTLALETRDAIAPRIRAVVAFCGRGVVYVLTQVVGRALGLIGRGIVQGLGGSVSERKNKRF